jgi:hypothetical protein
MFNNIPYGLSIYVVVIIILFILTTVMFSIEDKKKIKEEAKMVLVF